MYNEQLEALISAALADGVLTEKEKQILFKKAQGMGIDLDEFEMVLDARLVELKKAEKKEAEKSAPKSDKYGTVRKCPACGAIVPAFQGTCSECGHEFMDVDANASSAKLAELLLDTNDVNKQKHIIETFPIPNAKADLLEFLTALKPRISDTVDPLSNSYFKKYEECIEKAKVSFSNDKLVVPFIQEFDSLRSKRSRSKIKTWFLSHKIVSGIIIFMLLSAIINTAEAVYDSFEEKSKGEMYEKIQELVDKKVSDDEMISFLKETKDKWGDEKSLSILVNNDYMDAAIYHFQNNLDLSSGESYKDEEDFRVWPNSLCEKCLPIVYKGLIEHGRAEEAWNYTRLSNNDVNSYYNNDVYFNYMRDVVSHYCSVGEKDMAESFVKNHIKWFKEYVDPYEGEWKNDSERINSTYVLDKLNQIIANY